MNASTIVDPSMTLEEKLKAIDEAMKKMQDEKNANYGFWKSGFDL